MRITIKDIHKIDSTIRPHYLHVYAKSTGDYKVLNGCLYSIYDTKSIRIGMLEKIDRAVKAIRLSTKHKEMSVANATKVINVINILEGSKMNDVKIEYPSTVVEKRDKAYRVVKALLIELGMDAEDSSMKKVAGKYAAYLQDEAKYARG